MTANLVIAGQQSTQTFVGKKSKHNLLNRLDKDNHLGDDHKDLPDLFKRTYAVTLPCQMNQNLFYRDELDTWKLQEFSVSFLHIYIRCIVKVGSEDPVGERGSCPQPLPPAYT